MTAYDAQFVDVSSSKASVRPTALCQHYDEGNDANGQHASKVKVEQQWTADELIIAQPSGNRRTFLEPHPMLYSGTLGSPFPPLASVYHGLASAASHSFCVMALLPVQTAPACSTIYSCCLPW